MRNAEQPINVTKMQDKGYLCMVASTQIRMNKSGSQRCLLTN